MDRFRVDGVIESDIPPQIKTIRRVRIELARLFSLPPVKDLLPREATPPPSPFTVPLPSSEASKQQAQRSPGAQAKTPGSAGFKLPGFLERPEEKTPTKGKQAAEPQKSSPDVKTGKPGEPPSQVAAGSRPWLPLGVALCTSLGANLYFFWMWMDARGRYRRLVQRQRSAGETPNDQ
jgi:hypothetical protein